MNTSHFSGARTEILAPCGSRDALTAAVRQGADAVYMGMQQFSARAYADNFGSDELLQSITYCHLHGVKVHITLNTLVSDEELQAALQAAKTAYLAGADAFIVQDLGLAVLIKKICPDAELHASTQLTAHTPEAVRFLYNSGFDRVVLAREMSREEIAETINCSGADIEVFVHGALCMCVSGQCYLSAMLGGRSGNRGRCAQPCRLPFSVKGGTGHDLSLKDNCIIDRLPELDELGVASAKIEGRMKRPEYVGAAVKACTTALENGSGLDVQLDRLKAVFSRSGFTSGYYDGKTGRQMFGTRSKDDVTAATNKLLAEIRNEYKNERQSRGVNFSLTVKAGENVVLAAESGGATAQAVGAVPKKAVNAPLSQDKARTQLAKTGGTPFFADEISVNIGEGLTIPVSELNAMRRNVLDSLAQQLSQSPQRENIPIDIPTVTAHRRVEKMRFRACFPDCDIDDEFKRCEKIFVPLFSRTEEIEALLQRGFSVGVKLPRVIFGGEERVKAALRNARAVGVTDVYCGNIGTAALCVKMGFAVHGGFSLNAFNTQSLEFLRNMGLDDAETSIELTAKQINALTGVLPRGVVGYGYLPLMITRNCPNKNGFGCKKCGGESKITDRKGIEFTLMCDGFCTELLNSAPLVLSDKLSDFKGADFMTLLFTHEPSNERASVLRLYENGLPFDGKLTRGLYYRGVE